PFLPTFSHLAVRDVASPPSAVCSTLHVSACDANYDVPPLYQPPTGNDLVSRTHEAQRRFNQQLRSRYGRYIERAAVPVGKLELEAQRTLHRSAPPHNQQANAGAIQAPRGEPFPEAL